MLAGAGISLLTAPAAPQFIYHCIGILRVIKAKARDPDGIGKVIGRMMTHTEER